MMLAISIALFMVGSFWMGMAVGVWIGRKDRYTKEINDQISRYLRDDNPDGVTCQMDWHNDIDRELEDEQ